MLVLQLLVLAADQRMSTILTMTQAFDKYSACMFNYKHHKPIIELPAVVSVKECKSNHTQRKESSSNPVHYQGLILSLFQL